MLVTPRNDNEGGNMSTKEAIKINNHEEFNKALLNYNIPAEILLDVKNRIGDWTSSGGSLDDPYIKQQWKFVENYINLYIRG